MYNCIHNVSNVLTFERNYYRVMNITYFDDYCAYNGIIESNTHVFQGSESTAFPGLSIYQRVNIAALYSRDAHIEPHPFHPNREPV